VDWACAAPLSNISAHAITATQRKRRGPIMAPEITRLPRQRQAQPPERRKNVPRRVAEPADTPGAGSAPPERDQRRGKCAVMRDATRRAQARPWGVYVADRARQAAGAAPNSRLNARLNAASDS
jgi:hypothetical protein